MNEDIKLAAGGAGVRLWQIAERLSITDSSFSRKLRRELASEERGKILAIIRELQTGGLEVKE